MKIERDQEYWGLWANHIRDRCEDIRLLAIAKSREELQDWVKSMSVEPYDEVEPYFDGTRKWNKSFRKGSPLEWYNPFLLDTRDSFGAGIATIGSLNMFLMNQEEKFTQTIESYLINRENE